MFKKLKFEITRIYSISDEKKRVRFVEIKNKNNYFGVDIDKIKLGDTKAVRKIFLDKYSQEMHPIKSGDIL